MFIKNASEFLSRTIINMVTAILLLVAPTYQIYHDFILSDKYIDKSATVVKKYIVPETDTYYARNTVDIMYQDGTKDYIVYSDVMRYNLIEIGDVIKTTVDNPKYNIFICAIAYIEYIILFFYGLIIRLD